MMVVEVVGTEVKVSEGQWGGVTHVAPPQR